MNLVKLVIIFGLVYLEAHKSTLKIHKSINIFYPNIKHQTYSQNCCPKKFAKITPHIIHLFIFHFTSLLQNDLEWPSYLNLSQLESLNITNPNTTRP